MVGTDRRYVAQSPAELPLFVIGSKRRRAFGDGAESFHVLFREREIMRTGLASHIDPACKRFGDERDPASATDVNDVQTAAGFSGEVDRATDRLEFRRDGP